MPGRGPSFAFQSIALLAVLSSPRLSHTVHSIALLPSQCLPVRCLALQSCPVLPLRATACQSGALLLHSCPCKPLHSWPLRCHPALPRPSVADRCAPANTLLPNLYVAMLTAYNDEPNPCPPLLPFPCNPVLCCPLHASALLPRPSDPMRYTPLPAATYATGPLLSSDLQNAIIE